MNSILPMEMLLPMMQDITSFDDKIDERKSRLVYLANVGPIKNVEA